MSSEHDPAANRRRFLQYLAASPLHGRGRRVGLRRNVPAEDDGARPADVGAAAVGPSHQVAEGSHQRLRSRAGLPAERAAGAFRLHGLRHRRRSDPARQPRGLPQIPAPAAAAGRRQQGRHERRHPRHANTPRRSSCAPVGGQTLVPRRRRSRGVARAAKAGDHLQILSTRPSDTGRGRHQGARRADLDAALRHQQVGGRRGHRHARREGRLHGAGGHRRSQRRPQPGNAGPAAARATRATATAATTARACGQPQDPRRCGRASTSPGCATPSRRR